MRRALLLCAIFVVTLASPFVTPSQAASPEDVLVCCDATPVELYLIGSDANKLRGDRVIWRELLKRAELPTDIPLDGLAKRLLEEKGDFCGNLKIARGFGRSLSAEHRKAIKAAVA